MPYTKHEIFIDPLDEDQKIWRYMDIKKFESLISRSQLFFARASLLEKDPFEGTFLKREMEYQKENNKSYKGLSYTVKNMRDYVLINCWHCNKDETDGMWKLYGSETEGIAIQSTISNLKNSFHSEELSVYSGLVNYKNYEEDTFEYPYLNLLLPYLCKRNEFAYEKEYRAVVHYEHDKKTQQLINWENEESTNGKFINVDLNLLLKNVFISPYRNPGLFETASDILKSKFPDMEIQKSSIEKAPYF